MERPLLVTAVVATPNALHFHVDGNALQLLSMLKIVCTCSRLGTLGEFIMAHPTEEQIRKRAFELWERAGKPEGREDEFWQQAQRELQDAEERGDLDKGADI
jgi:hypothetical protein